MELDEKIVRHSEESALPPQLYEAHEMLWSNDIFGAKEFLANLLQSMEKEGKKSAWLTYALSEVVFWQQGLHIQDKGLRKELEKLLDETEKLAEDLMDRFNPDTTFTGLLRGGPKLSDDEKTYRYLVAVVCSAFNVTMRAVYHFRIEEPLRGVFFFRKSWKIFDKAIKVQQKREEKNFQQDIELRGLINFGMFHLAFSLIPPSLQLLTAIAGFEADRESAIKELYECYNSGCTMATPAALILVMVERFLYKKEEEATNLYNRVHRQYPNSFIVGYFGGFIHRLKGEIQEAIQAFEITQQFAIDKGFKQLEASTHYSMGYCHSMLDDWQKCREHYQVFIDTPIEIANKNFRPWAAYTLGMGIWIVDTENRASAKDLIAPLYQRALKEWIREEESYDIFSKRKMKKFLKNNSFTDLEVVTATLGALLEGKQVEKARPHLDKLKSLLEEEEGNGRDYHAIWALYTAECYKIEEDFEKAEEYLQLVLKEEARVKNETWVVPYALLSIATVASEQKDWSKTKEYIKKIKKYSKYDWEKLIAFQVYALKQTVREVKGRKEEK